MRFPPHFHGSVNEHLSASDFPEYPWTCHFTFLLPPSLSRNVSSSVAACKNAEYLHLLEPATVARSPPKAAHGPMNSLTNHDSLCFPIQESLVGGQAAFLHPARPPWGKDSLCAFFSWTFNSSVQVLADFLPKMFSESPCPKKEGERALQTCSQVHRWLTTGLCPGA